MTTSPLTLTAPYANINSHIKTQHEKGTKIILHTCRDNEHLTMAVDPRVQYSDKKIYADIYIDDRAVNTREVINKMTAEEYIVAEIKALKDENAQLLSDLLKEKEAADLFRKLLRFDESNGNYCIGKYGYVWKGDKEHKKISDTLFGDNKTFEGEEK